MLRACRRITTEFTSFYSRRESIFASFVADTIFTSFRQLGSKRADSEVVDFALNAISCKSLLMDPPSSIITQVSRDQDHSQLNSYQASLPNSNRGDHESCSVKMCYNIPASLHFAYTYPYRV